MSLGVAMLNDTACQLLFPPDGSEIAFALFSLPPELLDGICRRVRLSTRRQVEMSSRLLSAISHRCPRPNTTFSIYCGTTFDNHLPNVHYEPLTDDQKLRKTGRIRINDFIVSTEIGDKVAKFIASRCKITSLTIYNPTSLSFCEKLYPDESFDLEALRDCLKLIFRALISAPTVRLQKFEQSEDIITFSFLAPAVVVLVELLEEHSLTLNEIKTCLGPRCSPLAIYYDALSQLKNVRRFTVYPKILAPSTGMSFRGECLADVVKGKPLDLLTVDFCVPKNWWDMKGVRHLLTETARTFFELLGDGGQRKWKVKFAVPWKLDNGCIWEAIGDIIHEFTLDCRGKGLRVARENVPNQFATMTIGNGGKCMQLAITSCETHEN